MCIKPAVAIFHTVYGIYHLSRKPSGRTPASSASYMLFASFFDCSILPFYAFSALVARTRQVGWTTVLSNGDLVTTLSNVVFYLATAGGGLHVVSLAISLYLAVTFRKITKLPPDMNPLEDNLTSRHKRSKSSLSTVTSSTTKRLSTPLETKRSSGAPYEDLARPPTIPFFHTRTQSSDSFSTYKSTVPPSSRGADYDARKDLPSNRRYQPVQNPGLTSVRSSMVDIKRSSYIPSSGLKRSSYQEVPTSDHVSIHSTNQPQKVKMTEPWYASDSLSKRSSRPCTPGTASSSPKKHYTPLPQHQHDDFADDISTFSVGGSEFSSHPNPLSSNPSTPPPPRHGHRYNLSSNSPLSEITNKSKSNNRRVSGDITNMSSEVITSYRRYNDDGVSELSDTESQLQLERQLTPAPLRNTISTSSLASKSKYYGELKPGTPPVMIGGGGAGTLEQRQVSSGHDYHGIVGRSKTGSKFGKREVSGKVVEEGRGFGARLRKVSGI
jgi:hypothetical protein